MHSVAPSCDWRMFSYIYEVLFGFLCVTSHSMYYWYLVIFGSSNLVGLADLCFYCALPVSSIIIRLTGIVCIVSSVAPFFNRRLCLECVSLFISGQSLPKPNSPVSPNPRFSMPKSSLFPGLLTLFSINVVLINIG